MIKGSSQARLLVGLATIALVATACTSSGATTAPSANTTGPFSIGYSNGGGVGNGFREEQVCTAKAEATALGTEQDLQPINVIHRNTDAAGQLSDLRTLISQNVNAIVFNPNDPDALNPALAEAHAAGIVTVSVDAYVTDPNTWNLYNNQVKYAQLGAEWLFKQMGGTGNRLVHARPRRPPGRLRPRHRLQQRAEGLPEHQGPEPGRDVHRLGSGHGHPDHQRRDRQRRLRQDPGHLGVRHGRADRRCDQGRQQEVRADRRRRHRRLRRAAARTRPTIRASSAPP